MIQPTIGRVVWFYVYSPGQGHKGPLAAHVCKVHSERMVNLLVISEEGIVRPETSVHLAQDNEEVPAGNYCCWMPYQKGQAQKTEALEKKLEEKA